MRQTIRKFLKNNHEALAVIKDEVRGAALRAEAEILTSYLPAPPSEEAVKTVIAETIAALPERGPKAMGAVMATLKTKFGSDFDARQANAWIKAALG